MKQELELSNNIGSYSFTECRRVPHFFRIRSPEDQDSDRRIKQFVIILTRNLLVCGCAGTPETIAPEYVGQSALQPRVEGHTKHPRGSDRTSALSSLLSSFWQEDHNRMQYMDDQRESGAFYVVPRKNGLGKKIVRRPHPPPTSSPLDDDFDIITRDPTTVRDGESEWGTFSRYSSHFGAPSSSVLSHNYDGSRSRDAHPATAAGVPVDADPNRRALRRATRKSYKAHNVIDHYDLPGKANGHGAPAPQTKRISGAVDGSELGVSRKAHRGGGESTRGQAHAGEKTRREREIRQRPERDTIVDTSKGHEFELVNQRVLEDGPDRTVTLSTWREAAITETNSAAAMSVYYINPDEYVDEGMNHLMDEESHAPSIPRKQDHKVRSKRHDHNRKMKRELSESLLSSESERRPVSSQPKHSRRADAGRERANSAAYNTPPLTSTPSPRIRKSSSKASQYNHALLAPLLTSTPIKEQVTRPFSRNSSDSMRTSYQQMPSASASLEAILSECQPSLLHISSALSSLGIRTPDHLCAVRRLTDETRDREVRDVALRCGITIMEWAILLDKLRSL